MKMTLILIDKILTMMISLFKMKATRNHRLSLSFKTCVDGLLVWSVAWLFVDKNAFVVFVSLRCVECLRRIRMD